MLLTLVFLGFIIGANNFAAALVLGALGQAKRVWRAITVFGVFEFFVPLFGIWLGQQTSSLLGERLGWLAPVIFVAMGLLAIHSSIYKNTNDEQMAQRITTWKGLVLLELALCVDNLVVGFALGLNLEGLSFRGIEPFLIASTIALFAMGYTWLGMRIGDEARRYRERYAKLGSGLLLFLLAAATWLDWV